MDLLPDEEQAEVAAVSGSFLEDRLPVSRLFELDGRPEVVDASTWSAIADLGWFGLGLAEEAGGVGYTLAEEALLFHEIGQRVGPTPLLATSLAVHAASAAGADDVRDALMSGSSIAAIAVAGRGEHLDLFDADRADLVLAVADDSVTVHEASSIARREPVECIDETVSLVRVAVADMGPGLFTVTDPSLMQRGVVLTAAMLSGIADAARDDAVEYAKEREQFGKAIGTFQAIKHFCSDCAVRSEKAYTQVLYAALAGRDGLADAAIQASAAKVVATDAAIHNAATDVQVHGGYGFTAEYRPHFFVKRARVLDRIFGDDRAHLAALVA